MKEYTFYICDVFTQEKFGGSQLAVIPDATGLSSSEMQKIAREFNFSESSFVFPAEKNGTRKVRIYTPSIEVPFAGHPNIGTAFVLASIGAFGSFDREIEVTFEEKAGLVPIVIGEDKLTGIRCELRAPEALSIGKAIPAAAVAKALSITEEEIKEDVHSPIVASVGLPFVIVELRDRSVLERIKVRLDGFEEVASFGVSPDIHAYVRGEEDFSIHARMFAPLDGVLEDPATGSANCALVGLLASLNQETDGDFFGNIFQGYEMGRPSQLEARVEKNNNEVVSTWIAGYSVMVSKGVFYVD